MLYSIAHSVQKHLPWLWDWVEALNSCLFEARVRERLRLLNRCCPQGVRIACESDADALVVFFARQPEESFRWFRPHGFDKATLRRLLRRKSYVMYIEELDGEICGYAFLRCFFNGKCFLGKMVDCRHQGRGVCTRLCAVGMDMATMLGLRMFESINKENVGSLKASQKACCVRVVEELEDGDILVEDTPLRRECSS